ncbi:MAG: NAD(P)/FAD-dependent oxidoreductase [Pricia sp.]
MEKSQIQINIVGAGISGLIAASILEKQGYSVTIHEQSDRAGGRVKTDDLDGFLMDHGFQVLLDAYPLVNKYLDLKALKLQPFLPGAVVFKNGKQSTLGDPLRSLSLLVPTLFSGIGTFSDKLKIFSLNMEMKKTDVATIFESEETSTLDYLKEKGFSDAIITSFFKPFFSGIFLEPDLRTSSRMFKFVYKMFGEGKAVLPQKGIGAIAEQLISRLESTNIRYNVRVENISNNDIILSNGETVSGDYTVMATNTTDLVQNLRNQKINWKGCDTLYFSCSNRVIDKPLIGLIADDGALINNIFYLTSLGTNWSANEELLCVTVVKNHDYDERALVEKVRQDLGQYCGITKLDFIKRYRIPKGLPDLTDIRYDMAPSETQLKDTLFLAGDHLLNGSLNAAMLSGEKAALGIIEIVEGDRGVIR